MTPCFPTLWIGKSVFSRASMPHSFFGTEPSFHGPSRAPFDFTLRDEAERAMGAAKGRADRRSSSPYTSSAPKVDSAGDPVHHTGGHEGDGRPRASGTWPNVDQRTRELGPRAPGSTAHQTNRGLLMRTIRDLAEGASGHILSFGRFRGHKFDETPMGYRRWAVAEVQNNAGASEDLKMFANWANYNLSEKDTTKGYVAAQDPEASATIPYNPSEDGSWAMLPLPSTSGCLPTVLVAPTATSKAAGTVQASTAPVRRTRPASQSSAGSMQQDPDAEVLDEINHLQTRLAILRDRHGLAPGPEAEARKD